MARPAAAAARPCRNILKPAEHALVRLAIAGLNAADADKGGGRVRLAGALIELRKAADVYRGVLEAERS